MIRVRGVYPILLVMLTVWFSSCSSDGWSRKEKSKLIDRCRVEGGSRSYCKCYLENAMNTYPAAEDMEDIEFEKAVALSINCK